MIVVQAHGDRRRSRFTRFYMSANIEQRGGLTALKEAPLAGERPKPVRLSPQCHPGPRKVVGAAGFEPAAPWAQDSMHAMIDEEIAPDLMDDFRVGCHRR